MCLPILAACKKDENPVEETQAAAPVSVISGGVSEYVIVYSNSTENGMSGKYYKYATILQSLIQANTDAKLQLFAEDKSTAAKEIVIGKQLREVSYSSPVTSETYGTGYSLFMSGDKIVLEAGSEVGLKLGMYALLKDLLGVDLLADPKARPEEGKTEFTLPSDYAASETFASVEMPHMSAPLSEFAVCYTGTDYNQRRAAVILQQEIKKMDKVVMERVDKKWAEDGKYYFWFEKDTTLASGTFRINTVGTKITVSAKDYYGYLSAARAIMELRKDFGYYPFHEGSSNQGVHLDYLTAYEETAKYAYNNTSEYRVMFYNVFWGGQEVERGILQTEVIREYKPDVLGLQEFKENRRGSMVPTLKSMGYEETMDYKKGNFVAGNSGETKDSLYNYVPIFYNSATTKCVESGYYRYDSQISVEESASKSLSWAVMESKTTGDRYSVVNTHMCTQNDTIRRQQAVEAVKLVNQILTRYNVPVFLGGDYNGTYDAANFGYFAGKNGGFTDIEKNNLAKVYTSKLKSYHRDGPYYDTGMGLMWPADNDDTGVNPSASVDHIMMKNATSVSISVYGVIADNYAMCGGDHYPIFTDFSIN
jgi:endonuclease/exonuclease/phosphatase family metal-dependent hydrolase